MKTYGKRSAAITESGTENVELSSDAIYVSISFIPVNLHGIANSKRQRNINVLAASTQCPNRLADVTFGSFESHFYHQPIVDSLDRMVLLLVGFECIFLQALQNETDDVWRDHDDSRHECRNRYYHCQRYCGRFRVFGQSAATFFLLRGTYAGFFIVVHSDNHLVAIPSHLIVLIK